MSRERVEHTYQALYADTIEPGGKVDIAAVKRVCYEHAMMRERCARVYDEVTAGRVSNPLADPDKVIEAFHDFVQDVVDGG